MPAEVWEAFALSTAGWVSPGAVLVTLVLLTTERGGRKAGALWGGYAIGLTLVGLVVLVLGAQDVGQTQSPREVQPAIVVLGSLLFVFAFRIWRSKREDAGPVRFLKKLDGVRARRLAAFGLLGSVVNFKNLALFVAALTPLTALGGDVATKAPFVVACVLIFTSAIAIPIVLFAIGRKRVQPLLIRAREALERHQRHVSLVALPLLGLLLLWRGLSPLLG